MLYIIIMYKLSNGNISKHLLNIYKLNKDIHTHFTGQANHFRFRRGNTEFVYRTFAFFLSFSKVFLFGTKLFRILILMYILHDLNIY